MKAPSDEVIKRLREASRVFVREHGVLRAEQKGASLTYTQGHALIEIERHGALTVGELASVLKLNKSSTSRMLAKLHRKRWIAETSAAGDTRRKPFRLTAEGRKRLQKLHIAAGERTRRALVRLSKADQETVVRGMELYAAALLAAAEDESEDNASSR